MSTINKIQNDENLAETIANWASANDAARNGAEAIERLQDNPKAVIAEMVEDLWGDDLALNGEDEGEAVKILMVEVPKAIEKLKGLMD